MKKRLLTTIIATVFTLSTLTACGEKPAPAPADPTPVAEEPTVKPEDPAPVVEAPEEVKELTPAKQCNEKLWYATKDWPVSDGWDEHSDVTCVQIADIFLWDGMTYEDLIAAFRNSEINGDIDEVSLWGQDQEENGLIKEFEEGRAGFYAFPDTFEEWRQAYRENREQEDILYDFSGDYLSVYLPGVSGKYGEDEEHGYYYSISALFSGRDIYFGWDSSSDDPYDRVVNEVDIEKLAKELQTVITPWEDDGKSGDPVTEAVTRFSKDQSLTPLNFDEMFSDWENIPVSCKNMTNN